jgi:hypothetical protein
MARFWSKLALAGAFAVVASGIAADEKDAKKDAKPVASAKAPDWTAFANAGEMLATVVSATDDSVTVRVSWAVPSGGGNRGGRGGGRPNVKEQHTDYDLKFADGGMARWKKLPPKIDGDGKKAAYTPKEMETYKKPTGAPGYAAERTDLKAGYIVELHLLRPKEIKADKATAEDLSVKYAIIVGENPKIPVPEKKENPAAKKKEEKK